MSEKRLGKENLGDTSRNSLRTVFQQDLDRILFSAAFRRLQNKTQVFPFPKSDFVHNRLTHSLETSSVGRSLGNIVGQFVLEKYPTISDRFDFSDFGAIVSSACLAHDIGNPPFGHSGEDAIRNFFLADENQHYFHNLTPVQVEDLKNFEGNAAGFRLLAQTPGSISDIPGGLSLTYSTYSSFIKYPKGSLPKRIGQGSASTKKFSYFDSEKDIFEKIFAELQIPEIEIDGHKIYLRHPLVFLVEAADDICYTLIDYEDGFHAGILTFDEVEDAFATILASEWNHFNTSYNRIYDKASKINYLRSKAINSLVEQAAEEFITNDQSILSGQYNFALLDKIKSYNVVNHIKIDSSKRIYNSDAVLKIEIPGFRVLPFLLNIFLGAIFNPESKFNDKILKMIPNQYLGKDRKIFENDYDKILNITMYISAMTDKYAVEMYKQLNGISLGN